MCRNSAIAQQKKKSQKKATTLFQVDTFNLKTEMKLWILTQQWKISNQNLQICSIKKKKLALLSVFKNLGYEINL